METDTSSAGKVDTVGESLELLAAAESAEYGEFAIDSDDDGNDAVDVITNETKAGKEDENMPNIEDIDLGDPLSLPAETSMEERVGNSVEVSLATAPPINTSSGSINALKKQTVSAQEDPLSAVWNNPSTNTSQSTNTSSVNGAGKVTQYTTTNNNHTATPGQSTENGMSTFMSKTLNQSFSSTFSTLASKAANSLQDAVQNATRVTTVPPSTLPSGSHHLNAQGSSVGRSNTVTPKIYSMSNNNMEQRNNEMDTTTKSSLITSALGSLISGERVILFLTHISNVKDSSSMQTCMGLNADGSVEKDLVWCCIITFYRFVLFSYKESEFSQSSLSMQKNTTIDGEIPSDNNGVSPFFQSVSISRTYQEARKNYYQSNGKSHYIIQIPLASIDRVEKSAEYASSSSLSNYDGGNMVATTGIVIHGKDNGRLIQFTTQSFAATMKTIEHLNTYAFPGRRNLGYLFAFESRRAEVMNNAKSSSDAQHVKPLAKPRRYDALLEYHRMGAIQPRQYVNPNGIHKEVPSPWCPYMNANSNYELCESYPNILFGPSSVNDATAEGLNLLRETAAFRSGYRMHALAWASGYDGASIWRSSQPKVGLQGNRSPADEFYMKKIAECAAVANSHAVTSGKIPKRPSLHYLKMLTGCINETDLMLDEFDKNEMMPFNEKCMLKIFDLRPKSSAMANRTAGYGYENTSHYKNVTLSFHGIGNIHAVRDSYQKLSNLCMNISVNDIQWGQLVEETKWLSQIRLILCASWQVAFHVKYNRLPVLVHCSHGWDRTSQVSALAQLLLDPYYRTRVGFSCLIEKDFLALGHPFHTRCGHGEGRDRSGSSSGQSSDEGQLAPIFIQFLDCVYQIVNQYPDFFEFNTKYLLLLSEHVYSCRFGTFLCDTEKDREISANIRQTTYCLWEYLDAKPMLINKFFDKTSSMNEDDGDLMMPLPTLLRNVTLWIDRHCMHGPKPSLQSLLSSNIFTSSAHDEHSLPCKDDTRSLNLDNAIVEAERWKKIAEEKEKELVLLKAQIEEK